MIFDVRLLPVLIAAVAHFFLGMLWYSPVLFGKPWMKAVGMTEEKMKQVSGSDMGIRMVVALITGFIMAFVISYIFHLVGVATVREGLRGGFILWLGFVLPLQTSPVLWEGRGMNYWMINASYWLVSMLVMSTILVVLPLR